MKLIKWLFVFSFLSLLSWFSYLNAAQIRIDLFGFEFSLSVAILVLLALLTGVVFTLLLLLPDLLVCRMQNRKLAKKVHLKEKEIANLRHISVKGIYDD